MFMDDVNKITNPGFRTQYAYLDEEKNDQIRKKSIVYNNDASFYFVLDEVLENQLGETDRVDVKKRVDPGIYQNFS